MVRVIRRWAGRLGVRHGPAAALLWMCWVVLAVFSVAFLGFRHLGYPVDTGFGLGRDRGYGEVFFVIMTIWVVVLLVTHAVRSRSPVLAAWSLAFAVLLADDWFRLHETYGFAIGRELGLRAAFGEVVWLGGLALVVGGLLIVTHLRSRGVARQVSGMLFWLSVGLVFCGVVLDLVHSLVDGYALNTVAILVEDGGEIAVMCLLVSFVFAVVCCGHRPPAVGSDSEVDREVDLRL